MKKNESKSARGERIMKANHEVHRLYLSGKMREAEALFNKIIEGDI